MTANANEPIHDDSRFNHVDFSEFRFPSGGLTVGAVRRKHPKLFDEGLGGGRGGSQPIFFFDAARRGHAQDVIGEMLFCERFLALRAYAEACDMEPPNLSREEAIDELTSLYVRYGIAVHVNGVRA